MAKEVLLLVEDADEGGYVARALGYSVFTEADTWDELKRAPFEMPCSVASILTRRDDLTGGLS
jgi:hypothetical protein